MTRAALVTAVVVEDEPLARRRLRDLARSVPWLDVVAEASNSADAVTAIDQLRPDVVFLDVRLARGSGLDVLAGIAHRPAVVFTTAFDKYAVTAFELGAVDYLLKPFGRERFARAADRLRAALGRSSDGTSVDRARELLQGPAVSRLFVRDAGRIVPLRVASIERVQAADDFVIVFAGTRQFLVAVTLSDLEARLDQDTFLRVHRSHLINLDHVAACVPRDDSRFDITMRSGVTITASRQRSRIVRALAR